jgi:hypothetical protein
VNTAEAIVILLKAGAGMRIHPPEQEGSKCSCNPVDFFCCCEETVEIFTIDLSGIKITSNQMSLFKHIAMQIEEEKS